MQTDKDATTILGTDKERQLDIRLDGVRVKLFTLRAQGRAADAHQHITWGDHDGSLVFQGGHREVGGEAGRAPGPSLRLVARRAMR